MVATEERFVKMSPLGPTEGAPEGAGAALPDLGKIIPSPEGWGSGVLVEGGDAAPGAPSPRSARAPWPAGVLVHEQEHFWLAGTPRSDVVPSRERPEGHYATPMGRTPLQQHLDYFDLNKDGKITLFETWWALRYMRLAWEPFNTIICFWLALAFHLPLFWWTQDSWIPSPLLTIHTKNAARTMRFLHGSSSKTLDPQGRFIPQVFESMWERLAPGKSRMTPRDVIGLVVSGASPSNPLGALASAFQWGLALWVFHDDNWCLRKSDVRGMYDGTAFYRLADRNGFPWYGMSARRDAVSHHNMG